MLGLRFDFSDLEEKMGAKIGLLEDRRAIHTILGETLLQRHQRRFLNEVAPDGTKWQALSPITLEARRSPLGILRESGELFRSLKYEASPSHAEIGTNLNHPKVLVHQHGAEIKPRTGKSLAIPLGSKSNRPLLIKKATIPERPYVGVGKGDEGASVDALKAYFGKNKNYP